MSVVLWVNVILIGPLNWFVKRPFTPGPQVVDGFLRVIPIQFSISSTRRTSRPVVFGMLWGSSALAGLRDAAI